MVGTRLCLITPLRFPEDFATALKAALSAGDVASLIIDSGESEIAGNVSRMAADHGVAAIAVGLSAADAFDGVHVETGAADVQKARQAVGGAGIVGAGGVSSRHDAMTIGELLPDYVLFGRLDGDKQPEIHPKALELATWWAQLFEIPAIVMGGADVASVRQAADAGIEFVALRSAVWDHVDGPAAAVTEANRLLIR